MADSETESENTILYSVTDHSKLELENSTLSTPIQLTCQKQLRVELSPIDHISINLEKMKKICDKSHRQTKDYENPENNMSFVLDTSTHSSDRHAQTVDSCTSRTEAKVLEHSNNSVTRSNILDNQDIESIASNFCNSIQEVPETIAQSTDFLSSDQNKLGNILEPQFTIPKETPLTTNPQPNVSKQFVRAVEVLRVTKQHVSHLRNVTIDKKHKVFHMLSELNDLFTFFETE